MISALKVQKLNQLLIEAVDHEKMEHDDSKIELRLAWKN
jgi:hypothetical protein